jgi:membrane peptidoglycan carboxypeptidase
MTILAQFVSAFALKFLRASWEELRLKLESAYSAHINDMDKRPSALAKKLLISGEDHRYYQHGGFDVIAMCRAAWRGFILHKREGASTIEMQLVRTLTEKYERTLKRKIHEIAFATLVSKVIPKDEIPAVYLEIAYFGWRMNGFSAALRRTYGMCEQLPPLQTAQIVARLKYPEPRSASPSRLRKIRVRGDYLLWLHDKHLHARIYQGGIVEVQYEAV